MLLLRPLSVSEWLLVHKSNEERVCTGTGKGGGGEKEQEAGPALTAKGTQEDYSGAGCERAGPGIKG